MAKSKARQLADIIVGDGTLDGRDVSVDGTKLDGIETAADVTDTANVTAAGALMDSEVTNLAQVKAFDSSDYATSAQGTTADSALQNVVEDTSPQLGGNLDLNSSNITGTGNINITGNLTTTGYIAGPATFTIDPAAVGDNTGTLVVAGNLQVDGTTTTINSTTLTVDDLNLTLASGAANAAAANGAGITIDGASATITYDGTNDEWDFSKPLNVTGAITSSGKVKGASLETDRYIYHAGDTNTYIDFGTDEINFHAGGGANQERLIISSSQTNVASGNFQVGGFTVITSARNMQNIGNINIGGYYAMDGVTIIDTSKNLTNIGTISSGAITSSGTVTSVGGVINTNTGANPLYVTRLGNTNESLKLYTDDRGVVFESRQDETADTYGNFIFVMDAGVTEPYFDVRKGAADSASIFHVDGGGNVGIGTSSPNSIVDIRENATGGQARLRLFNTDQTNSTAQSALLFMSPDVRANGVEIEAVKENADFSAAAGRDIAITFSPVLNNAATERMRIDSSGKVGIGNTNPLQKLSVNGLINSDLNQDYYGAWINGDSATNGYSTMAVGEWYTTGLYIQKKTGENRTHIYNYNPNYPLIINAGSSIHGETTSAKSRLGIGTFSPNAVVHIQGQNTAGLIVENGTGIASTQPYVSMAANNYSSGFGTFRWEDQRASQPSTSFIWEVRDGSGSVLAYDFRTGATGAAGSKLAITQSGNVGIGTSSPFAKSHIVDTGWSSGAPYGTVQLIEGNDVNDNNWGHLVVTDTSTANGNGGAISFATGASNALNPFSGIKGISEGTSYGGLGLFTRANGGTATERMRIRSDGTTTIGAAITPTYTNGQGYPLHVQASAGAQTYISISMPGTTSGDTGFVLGHDSTGTRLINRENDPIIFMKATGETMRIDSSGRLLIATQAADGIGGSPADLNNSEIGKGYINLNRDDTVSAAQIQFGKNGVVVGSIVTTSSTTYNTTSDRRVKENIADADDAGAVVDAIQVRKFDWKGDGTHQRYGMIAQELLESAPEVVHQPENSEEMMGVDYSKLVPMLVKEIQSLRARVAELEGE